MINYVIACNFGRRRWNVTDDNSRLLAYHLETLSNFMDGISKVTVVLNFDSLADVARANKIISWYKDMPIKFIYRKNIGYSYAAWEEAIIDGLEDKDIEYYMLMEDDYVPAKSNFYQPYVDKLLSDKRIGYVCSLVSIEIRPRHAGMSGGLLRKSYAKEIFKKTGKVFSISDKESYIGAELSQIHFLDNMEENGYSFDDIGLDFCQEFSSQNKILSYGNKRGEKLIVPIVDVNKKIEKGPRKSNKMINIFKPYVSPVAKFFVTEVLSSGTLTQGTVVDEFEDLLRDTMNLPSRPITTNSCTSAIDLAYELIGIGAGDNVITTAQTCFATNGSLLHRGANIYWADIDMDGLISVDSVREILELQPDIKAIVAVDWAGKLPDYKALKSFGIPVVEDAAHRWDDNLARRRHGDYVCYSFQAIKFLTTGDGGLLVAPEEEVTRGRTLRWFGLDRDNKQDFRSSQDIPEAGFKYHMNNINASIGKANIAGIGERVQAHNDNARMIIESVRSLKFIDSSYDRKATYWMLPLVIKEGLRDKFIEKLKARGVEANMVHSRNDKYTCMEGTFSVVSLDGLEEFSSSQVNIPCGWWLGEDNVYTIIDILSEIDLEFSNE